MVQYKYRKFIYPLLFLWIVALLTPGCDIMRSGSEPTSPASVAGVEAGKRQGYYPAELFPGLVTEEWFFFNPDKSFHHYEIFTYQYDADGRRVRGDFYHSETGISLVLTYLYKNGIPAGEHWENPYFPMVYWDIAYRYSNNRIVGGSGIGFYIWDFKYGFDSKGRRTTTSFTSDDPRAPRFTLYHQYDEKGKCLLATGQEQRGLDIVIVYTYAD